MSPRELQRYEGEEGVDYARPDFMRSVRRYRALGAHYLRTARRYAAGIFTDREWADKDRLRRGGAAWTNHRVRMARREAGLWYEAAARIVLLHGGHPIRSAVAWTPAECRVAVEDIPS